MPSTCHAVIGRSCMRLGAYRRYLHPVRHSWICSLCTFAAVALRWYWLFGARRLVATELDHVHLHCVRQLPLYGQPLSWTMYTCNVYGICLFMTNLLVRHGKSRLPLLSSLKSAKSLVVQAWFTSITSRMPVAFLCAPLEVRTGWHPSQRCKFLRDGERV